MNEGLRALWSCNAFISWAWGISPKILLWLYKRVIIPKITYVAVSRCSKFFSVVIYNTSTEHTILQNALILPHIDGLTSNLVCRWRRV